MLRDLFGGGYTEIRFLPVDDREPSGVACQTLGLRCCATPAQARSHAATGTRLVREVDARGFHAAPAGAAPRLLCAAGQWYELCSADAPERHFPAGMDEFLRRDPGGSRAPFHGCLAEGTECHPCGRTATLGYLTLHALPAKQHSTFLWLRAAPAAVGSAVRTATHHALLFCTGARQLCYPTHCGGGYFLTGGYNAQPHHAQEFARPALCGGWSAVTVGG